MSTPPNVRSGSSAANQRDEFKVEPIDPGVPINHEMFERERQAERDVLAGYARDDYPDETP